jgi:tRNA-specific 2-thiouridylase
MQGSALEKVLLPIGHLSKAEVKAIAARRLPDHARVLSKPESMGICFIGKRDMRDFLDDYITLTPGRCVACR